MNNSPLTREIFISYHKKSLSLNLKLKLYKFLLYISINNQNFHEILLKYKLTVITVKLLYDFRLILKSNNKCYFKILHAIYCSFRLIFQFTILPFQNQNFT